MYSYILNKKYFKHVPVIEIEIDWLKRMIWFLNLKTLFNLLNLSVWAISENPASLPDISWLITQF